MFVRNAWYVAAWAQDVGTVPTGLEILGEKVCIFRASSGRLHALEDACPHRKLPLSMGRVVGDALECGYHGLTFDGAGRCVAAPGNAKIPPSAAVRSYPVEERYGLVWIFPGDPQRANPDDIFPVAHYDEPGWGINRGDAILMDCNYLLVTDNLLDPSHVAWVHQSSFGTSAGNDPTRDTPLKTTVNDDGVVVARWMLGVEAAPFYKSLLPFEGPADRLQHYEVRFPCHAIIKAVFTPAGTGGPDAPLHPDAFVMDSYNFMTPLNERQTLYTWFQIRNVRAEDEAVSEAMSRSVRQAFEEDRVVLNAVQIGLDEATSSTLDLAIDAGPLRFRKRVQAMVAEEDAGAMALAS